MDILIQALLDVLHRFPTELPDDGFFQLIESIDEFFCNCVWDIVCCGTKGHEDDAFVSTCNNISVYC